MSTYHLKIITRDKVFFEDQVNRIVGKGVEGDLAILPNHSPLVTFLQIAPLKISNDKKEIREANVTGGLIKVSPTDVTILADAAEWPEDIDVERAKAAKNRAEERLKDDRYDIARAESALKRAISRLNVADTNRR